MASYNSPQGITLAKVWTVDLKEKPEGPDVSYIKLRRLLTIRRAGREPTGSPRPACGMELVRTQTRTSQGDTEEVSGEEGTCPPAPRRLGQL